MQAALFLRTEAAHVSLDGDEVSLLVHEHLLEARHPRQAAVQLTLSRSRKFGQAPSWLASSHVICGKATEGTRDQSYTQEGCAARMASSRRTRSEPDDIEEER